eukprot:COSAG03_NODE_22334_length_292_cov_0.922280_1_plen_26_part_01
MTEKFRTAMKRMKSGAERGGAERPVR